MDPDTLETIITISKWTGTIVAMGSSLVGLNIFTKGVSNYNIAKSTYNTFPEKAKQEVGEPKLKQYFKEAASEQFSTKTNFDSHYLQIKMKNLDVMKEKAFREAGLIDEDGNETYMGNKNKHLRVV